jgi:hypothetical protein
MTRTLAPGIRARPRFVMPEADLPDPPAWEDDAFSRGPARRPSPAVQAPTLQWSTGLPTENRAIFAGWLCQRGRDTELDAAMERAGVSITTIRHSGGVLVTHWAMPTVSLFVIAEGVQTFAELRETSDRYGIALWWSRREDGGVCSHLRCRVLVRELLAMGYEQPLTLSVKSTLTGDLLAAFARQYAVLDAAAALWGRADLPFYAFSLALGPGSEVTRGSGSQARTIVPMMAMVPEVIDAAYLTAQWTTQVWAERVEGLLDATVAWSEDVSRRMEGHDVER